MTISLPEKLIIRNKGLCAYNETYAAMSAFTDKRDDESHDEIWFLEHPPVYTLGLSGKPQHIIDAGDIPVVKTDRGGQVTYHGPGQLMVYLLVDIKRKSIGVREFVNKLEQSVIALLSEYGIEGKRRENAPGVYVDHKKISALGIRVRRGCSYHGLSLNVDMDLTPYNGIHACGYKDLEMTQINTFSTNYDLQQVAKDLLPCLIRQLDYSEIETTIVNEACSNQAA